MKNQILTVLLIFAAIACNDVDGIKFKESSEKYLHFGDHIEYETTLVKIAEMTDEELDNWEREKDFTSLRNIIKQAYSELETIETQNDLSILLNKYSDIFILEDSTLTPKIKTWTHQAIANRQGYYKTGNFIHKIVGDYILIADESKENDLRKIVTIESHEEKIDGIDKYRITEPQNEISYGKSKAACSASMFATYYKNESGCKDDREVNLYARSFLDVNTDPSGTYYYPKVEIIVQPRRRLDTA